MTTSPKQILLFGEDELTSLPEGSPANPFHLQEKDLERQITATSGRNIIEQSARFNRLGSSGKTFLACLIGQEGWYSSRCRLIWKMKGTKSGRLHFQLAASTLPTEGIEFGLWHIIKISNGGEIIVDAEDYAKNNLLPTPQAIDGNGQGRNLRLKKDCNRDPSQPGSWRGDLKDYAIMGMLPTPTANDNPEKNTGKRNQDGLQKRAYQITGKTSQLNDQFVCEMMGFPINYLSLW